MDIRSLRAFVAVVDSGSFSAAAERLHLSQPAVSKRVSRLEQELGTQLFDRIGAGLPLTPAGKVLLPRARRLLAEAEDCERLVRNLEGRTEGPLSVATSHHIGLRRLPPVLRGFSAAFPAVQLELRFMDSEQACVAVARGEVELALVTLPPDPPAELELERIWPDPLVPCAAPDHPLGRAESLGTADLVRHPAVLPGPGTFTRALIDRRLQEQGLQVPVAMATNYLETLRMLAAVGLGWTILPATMVDEELVPLSLPELGLHRELGTVRHRRRILSSPAAAFAAALPRP